MSTKILFVGEHPLGHTGNSGMLNSIINDLDTDQYDFSIFAIETQRIANNIPIPKNISIHLATETAQDGSQDIWGPNKLLNILRTSQADLVVMVGLDIWRYSSIFNSIADLRDNIGFKWVWIFPYDLDYIRKDWVDIIKNIDFPCVYSKYGYNLLKPHVKQLEYFRPPPPYHEILHREVYEKRKNIRKRIFSGVNEDATIFGFIGNNQFRKDPQRVIKGFALAVKKNPDAVLYLHTEMNTGVFNLIQYCKDVGLKQNQVLSKKTGVILTPEYMVEIYNAIDCLVLCSFQEGLSWTVLEALKCGTPVIGSEGTAHDELLKDVGIIVPRTETAYLPLNTGEGKLTWMETKACSPNNIARAMDFFCKSKIEYKKELSEKSIKRGKEWISGVNDINEFLAKTKDAKLEVTQKNEILFIQHSAAGDLLMTTRCYKGLKERHSGIPLNVMTLPNYADILINNPYVKDIYTWDNSLLNRAKRDFRYVYNPHGDRIAPGHWGRNCNSLLSDFYWKILGIEPSDFYIQRLKPSYEIAGMVEDNTKPIAVIQTSGGDSLFRTYKYMSDVCCGLRDKGYYTIQIGGAKDYPGGADLNLAGKLNYRESAWVMERAKIAVTIDSFLSHLAGALGVSQVCLFGSGNAIVTRPNQQGNVLICRSPDYVHSCIGLGPCSAMLRDCPLKCTGAHDPKDILSDIDEIEGIVLKSVTEPIVIMKHGS